VPGGNLNNQATLGTVDGAAAQAGGQLVSDYVRFETYLSRIGDLIVSDSAKLATFVKNYNSGRWRVNPTDQKALNVLSIATHQFLWGYILRSAYDLYQGSTNLTLNPWCMVSTALGYNDYRPFANAPFPSTMHRVPYLGVYQWLGKSGGLYHNNSSPPDVLRPLFTYANPNQSSFPTASGAVQPWFFRRWWPNLTGVPNFDSHATGPAGCAADPR
jgi:hypothetical protein